MEIYKSIVAIYFTGFSLNFIFTTFIHKLALRISKKKLSINNDSFKFIIFFISSDYFIARKEKRRIKLREEIPLYRKETDDELSLRKFIQASNYLNLACSLLFIIICAVFTNLKLGFFIASFLLVRSISRSFEISYAFTKDAIKKERKSTRLTSGERIILGINSYVEIILNYSLVYYILALYQNEIIFRSFSQFNKLGNAIFRSVGISSFTGIGVSSFDIIAVIQLLTSLSLVYFAFASYIGNKG